MRLMRASSTEATCPEAVGGLTSCITEEGVLDLSGNVAEWCQKSDGSYDLRGGSYFTSKGKLKPELPFDILTTKNTKTREGGFRRCLR